MMKEGIKMKNKKLYTLEDIIVIRHLYNSFYKCTPCKLHKKSVIAFNSYKNERIHSVYENFIRKMAIK